MRRTMHNGRAARQGALVAAIMLLAAGSWVPAASGDQGGKPHDGSHGQGAQGAQGHEAEPAEQPKAPDNDDNDRGEPAKQHGAGHHKAKKHKARRPEHEDEPEHGAPSKSHPTPNANPGKTTICHRTGSTKHPWVTITVADRALPAHRRHGDLIPAPAGGCPKPAAAPSEQAPATGEPAPAKDQPAPAKPGDAKEKGKHGKTTICHRTGSESNPWVEITVADPALKAHRAHGDIIPAPAEGCPKPQPAATTAPTAPAEQAPVVGLGMGAQVPLPVTTVSAESQSAPAATAPTTTTPFEPGGSVTTVTAPSHSTPVANKTASQRARGQVLAETASSAPTAAQAANARTTDTGSRLPFTGLAVWLLALGGAGALLAGVALRRAHGMRR